MPETRRVENLVSESNVFLTISALSKQKIAKIFLKMILNLLWSNKTGNKWNSEIAYGFKVPEINSTSLKRV